MDGKAAVILSFAVTLIEQRGRVRLFDVEPDSQVGFSPCSGRFIAEKRSARVFFSYKPAIEYVPVFLLAE
jgi:hypothetical protein